MPKNDPEYMKKYYADHRDHILNELMHKNFHCPICNIDVRSCYKNKHMICKKHMDNEKMKQMEHQLTKLKNVIENQDN